MKFFHLCRVKACGSGSGISLYGSWDAISGAAIAIRQMQLSVRMVEGSPGSAALNDQQIPPNMSVFPIP